jgi:hypothetical protein
MQSRFFSASAGFFIAPSAWALHQQLGYMLVPVSCHARIMIVPLVTLIAAALALAGGWLSWRPARWRETAAPSASEGGAHLLRFLANLSLLFTALFLFAILLQGTATLFLNGCQR